MDNKFWPDNCPAKMSDARFITDYTSAKVVNQQIKKINNLKSSHEFRLFLQNNATKIFENQQNFFNENFKCKKYQPCNLCITKK